VNYELVPISPHVSFGKCGPASVKLGVGNAVIGDDARTIGIPKQVVVRSCVQVGGLVLHGPQHGRRLGLVCALNCFVSLANQPLTIYEYPTDGRHNGDRDHQRPQAELEAAASRDGVA
jgi:hypothetical protein